MQGRLYRITLVLVVMLTPFASTLLASSGADAQEGTTARTTDILNMRTGPSISSPVLLVIPYGETVTVRGAEQGGYLPIRYAGRDGWSSSDYLALAKPAPASGTAGTVTEALNLRSGPSGSSPVIVVMPAGAGVVVTGESSNGYLAVTWGGYKGYAHGDWIRRSGTPLPAPSEPDTPPTTGTAVTTEPLNMRAGAGTNFTVLNVIPAGTTVNLTGQSANGFYGVTWNGQTGWASSTYLRVSGGSAPAPTTPTPTQPPTPGGRTAVTTDDLNMRSGPGLGSTVILVIPSGATVSLTGQASNGYLQVTYSGRTGWSAQEWLRATSGTVPTPAPTPTPAPPITSTEGTGIVTEPLNMRTGAATTYPVVTVIPASARVTLTGKSSGNFLEVTYNGRTGWAHKDWITIEDAETRPTQSARVTETLNMRSGPATSYTVVTVMPAGSTVILTGQESNGFHSVTWNGRTGWAFSTYLDITPASEPQPTIPPTPVPTQVPPTPAPTAVPTQVAPQPTASAPIPTPNPVGVIPKPWPDINSNQGYHWTNTIVGPTRGTSQQAIAFAQNAGAVRMDEVENYINEMYRLAPQLGFDPSLLVAQSALETGYWKSYWWRERLNPAGLAINDDPSTHAGSQGFENGTVSARAQMAHMHAEVYGAREPLPEVLQGVDSSYEAVFQAGWAGEIVTLEDLGGTWATDTSYGYKIARVAAEIFG